MRRAPWILVLALAVATPAQTQPPGDVQLNVSRGKTPRIRIHSEVLQPSGEGAGTWSVQSDEVLARDLEWSAVFSVTRSWSGAAPPSQVEAIVGGRLVVSGGQVRLHGEVRDFPARRLILTREYRAPLRDWRAAVHAFADDVVLQFTGEPGIAQTRIAFISPTGRRTKELYVMDYDGARIAPLTDDRSIAQSPSWSPDGSLVLYTSYRGGRGPKLQVLPAIGGRPFLVSGRPGLNTSGAYSPDGREIACTLSQDGNSEIYVLDARGGSPQRLTNNRAIDTAPAWSPTGREIAFTSDRAGAPQVYVMDREGGNVRRLTWEVGYTDSPAWSPKGDQIAFVARTGGGFDIYVCRADGSGTRLVVSGGSNENPRWSPDGRHLVFASNREGRQGLYITDLDDAPPRRIDTGALTALSPAWSPRPAGGGASARGNDGNPNPGGRP
jgi:TolB protein